MRETNKSKLKDIIENTNLRTDENLYKLSRGITIVDIMSVLNSLVGILSSSTYKEFIRIFVEYFPNEFGGVELIADSYRYFSLKRKEQESRETCLKSKVVVNFHVRNLRNNQNKLRFLELLLLLFSQNVTFLLMPK